MTTLTEVIRQIPDWSYESTGAVDNALLTIQLKEPKREVVQELVDAVNYLIYEDRLYNISRMETAESDLNELKSKIKDYSERLESVLSHVEDNVTIEDDTTLDQAMTDLTELRLDMTLCS